MGSGWHEWPLVLFTVLGQCVVGATLISGLVWLELADQREARQRLVRSMFFIWLLMGIGFLASVMHLGSPLRAFNSLNRVGASALSNEIASGALFFAVGGFWWLLAVLEKMPAALGKIWLVITLLLGLLFVLAMTRVYQIDTVPTWYNGYTTSAFFLTILLSGPLFAALLLQMAKVDVNGWFIAGLSMAALVISAAVIVMQSAGLSTIHSSVQQAASLLPNYGRLQALRLILLALGLGCWLCPLIRRQPPRAVGLLAGLVLVLIAECIGRGLFYGLHMTVGMAVAG
ncbi:DmsC/YnfH family molybdoenzyme membrane anchor subunit [Klebsiella quasipneumoniae]|uniref:DmsC/YnfH family molybdoenzyme membrane anchor subunit n=1 Tax=Klebsiella quasipneumoniae TaxID=1463165 RepID=UPI0007CC4A20|nr:DmsC/YnfH family molybdoenzyme membrane anchor subunit [Klebsiella quasipneumoniae]UDC01103.1 dimethyl sulfoxide reductase anchor subunit [Klebsiella quasipneumoniae subsp. similipneumoniae]SAT32269.1 anaerobic dimethyl sulfoxide reductase subunit C [Klebsiella quasipneumoniae]VGP11888.1 Anaerobic dimethyl sulfoxide reductase chain C [Klebsiella quasipneumoniae subsp. similipneumoniae]HCC2278571.1 dimethyl sulfoxide reductase anchor subunit [Klebsiella quasipneumoniae]HCC2283024.1 dimethyl 